MLTLMAVNHHGIRATSGPGSLMTRNVARLPPLSCGLSRFVSNFHPVDQKKVDRALLPCGHRRCGRWSELGLARLPLHDSCVPRGSAGALSRHRRRAIRRHTSICLI
jgi:hypothetical protein